jgi:sulfatase maturation enzyme AslB (radical SAM superfamily)
MIKKFVIIKWFSSEPTMMNKLFERRAEAEKEIEEWFLNDAVSVFEKKRYNFTIDKVYIFSEAEPQA